MGKNPQYKTNHTHPLFRKDVFIETAFERRFQAMLRSAWHQRSWHVIVAEPGSGKTMGIRDMVRTAGSPAILAVTAPKNEESERAQAQTHGGNGAVWRHVPDCG